jgi:hypothetical protein
MEPGACPAGFLGRRHLPFLAISGCSRIGSAVPVRGFFGCENILQGGGSLSPFTEDQNPCLVSIRDLGGAALIAGHEYVGHGPVASQHRPSVQQHDEESNDREHERVPGLGIRPCQAVHLEVIQGCDLADN